jgi:ubiquinone/menaquinone biosynthesis C-methylase UbiE
MVFYRDRVYPLLVSKFGDPKPIRTLRQRIVPLARGKVLEIGVGAGANFPYYNSAIVSRLFALEPNQQMIRLASRQKHASALNVEFLDLPGERIPMEDQSIDTVVSTFTLCTIPGISEAIQGIRRVLKPDGQLILLELSLSPHTDVTRWQRRWEPIHHRLFEGLYLTRDMASLLTEGGFGIQQLECGYVTPFPKSWAYCCWGTAVPRK